MVPSGDHKDERSSLPAQLRRGTLEFCVLGLLRERRSYAPELAARLSEYEGLLISEGTLYPLLSRLRRDGIVSSEWEESPAGPPRRYYRITQDGEASLTEFISEWRRFSSAINTLLELQ